jgi:hypothetical protein
MLTCMRMDMYILLLRVGVIHTNTHIPACMTKLIERARNGQVTVY